LSQIGLLLRLYISRLKTFSRILDEGRLIFAALAAVAVLLAPQMPRVMEYQKQEANALARASKARAEQRAKQQSPSTAETQTPESDPAMQEYLTLMMGKTILPNQAVDRFIGLTPKQYFAPLIAMAACSVPLVILILTLWDNLGGFSTILFRDYMALPVCCLLAWTAPHLLLPVAKGALGMFGSPIYNHPALWWTAHAYFLVLAALACRVLVGTTFSHAAVATGGAWVGAVGGIWLYGIVGSGSAYLASPFMLYYLYRTFGNQFNRLGAGLLSRQRLKERLENATLNPRDADAHYQLGLIYAQRRQYDAATERFRKAIEIDPGAPDAHYQLARIARAQGRFADAIEYCRAAVRVGDKHSSSQVWREIGIASFLAGDDETARQTLEKYLDRRPYDPAGLCWYGRTMARQGQHEAARSAFEQAIEAVRTMPPARRRQVRSWEGEARREIKKLRSSAAVGTVAAPSVVR
jgi:TolA-binding protein